MRTIYNFNSIDLPGLDEVGGKGLALMQMTQANLPVPAGFVLAVGFFDPWMDQLRQQPAWDARLGSDEAELSRWSATLKSACHLLEFTIEMKSALSEALSGLAAATPAALYAVRSSSPEEDLEGASFAGGYETTLGVTTDSIELAVCHSFTSSFDERVLLYKREHGFTLDDRSIAVVVQQQVDANCAGVAFSINPLNNCFDEAVINANHGLGESVVSGEADPDYFVVDKLRSEIIETRIGGKQVITRLNKTGGTTREMHESPQQPALSSAQVLELTGLLEKVENYYKKPVDIEWAFSEGKFSLLQARPITTYLPLPAEMTTAPGQPKRLYANSTLIEQGLQDPISILGTDFLVYLLNIVGGPIAEGAIGPDGITFAAGGRYYMNISFAYMLGMKNAALAPGSLGDPRVTAILDGIDMKHYLGGQLPARLKSVRGKMMFKMLPMAGAVLSAYLRPGHILQKYQAALPGELRRIEAFSGGGFTLQACAVQLADLLSFFYGEYGIPMILAAQIAQQRIKDIFQGESTQVQDYLTNLGISLPGNKTTEMGEAMYALANSVELRRFGHADEFLEALENGTVTPDFARDWRNFLAEYGMRCPGEIDPAIARLSEQPGMFFDQLKHMATGIKESSSFFVEARARRESAYQALYTIALKKSKNKARSFEQYYKTWLTLGGFRETPKHYVITVINLFRRQALSIGRQMVVAGRLDDPSQIFDLTIADIDRAVIEPDLNLRMLAKQGTILTDKTRKSKLVVRIIDSRGKIFYPPHRATENGELSGVPISPGIVRGRVKVLQYASEKKILPGEILVARATDPGWTPLFINAGGIVLEIGGALQHGAVVAREYGIPCVSGVDEATAILHDGQLVEVDGSNGIVRVIE